LNGGIERILQKRDRQDMLREVLHVLDRCIERPPRGKRRVLYVEDNEDNVYVLKSRLTREGYTVLTAPDGAQGVSMAATEQPEIILMDLSLPVLDGWEATRRIKASEGTRHIPVIALTAHAMTGDKEKALAAGCDDFDTKPVEIDRLIEKIQTLIGKGQGS
jgi:CheY-like chemotaxis protein